MNHQRIYNELYQDFGPVIALSVCQVNAINLTMKVKTRDWKSGSFNRTDRVIKKAQKLLYELDQNDFNLVIALWKNVNVWQVGQDMDGLGGCEKKTFLQLLEKKGYESK
jgi:hypothetical protein